jgi:spore germination protein YaaH
VVQSSTNKGLVKKVFGWIYPDEKLTDDDCKSLTDLCFFSYSINPEKGTPINSTQISQWATNESVVTAKRNGVNVILTLVLSSGYSAYFGNAAAQETTIKSAIDALKSAGANGINVDIEGTSQTELVDFIALLSKRMKSEVPGTELSVDLEGGNSAFAKKIVPYTDYVILMGYDLNGTSPDYPAPVAPLYNFKTASGDKNPGDVSFYINEYLDNTPSEKLVLAVPYYGRKWKVAPENKNIVPCSNSGNAVSIPFYSNYIQWPGIVSDRKVEPGSMNPYLAFTDVDGLDYQLFFDDEISLQLKYDVVKQRGLAGIGIWKLKMDAGHSELGNLIATNFSSADITQSQGTIYDMGGPEYYYHAGEKYTFTIAPPGAKYVYLTFKSFGLATGDYLKIYDGSNTSNKSILLTGTKKPEPFLAEKLN